MSRISAKRIPNIFIRFILLFIKPKVYRAMNDSNEVHEYHVKHLWGAHYLVRMKKQFDVPNPTFWN